MKHPSKMLLSLCALCVGFAATACDTKVSQCNRLIDVANKHSTPLSNSLGSLSNIQEKPEVADEFATVVKTADDEIAGLEFKDEKVLGFQKDYRDLLSKAAKMGTDVAEASKSGDIDKLNEVFKTVDEVSKLEESIVNNVNTYCSAQ